MQCIRPGMAPSILSRLFPGQQCLLYTLRRQPALSWYEPPRNNCENRHDSHDDWSIVKSGSLNWKSVGGEKHRDHPAIPKDGDGLEWPAQPAKTPCRLRELVPCQEEAAKTDQTVRSGRGNTSCRHERRECHRRWEYGTCDHGRNSPDDKDSVSRLSIDNLSDPRRPGQHSISCDGKDEARCCEDSNSSVLGKSVSQGLCIYCEQGGITHKP